MDENSNAEKGVVYVDIWSLDPRTWEWNKVFVLRDFAKDTLSLRWRSWMTTFYMKHYLRNQNFYKIQSQSTIDNPDQRIVDDLSTFTRTTLAFSFTLFNVVIVSIISIDFLYSQLFLVNLGVGFVRLVQEYEEYRRDVGNNVNKVELTSRSGWYKPVLWTVRVNTDASLLLLSEGGAGLGALIKDGRGVAVIMQQETMKETMEKVPLYKKIVDHYRGPDMVTAKQQCEELERVAKTLPPRLLVHLIQ